MRKIDKKEILSKNYRDWVQSLEEDKHPKYTSSNNKYYFDIKMSLLYCQSGLCAYTEEILCDPELIDRNLWNDKSYNHVLTNKEKDSIRGDLEHFNESLKVLNGWLWENFFIVNTHSNCRIKHKKSVNMILKPDNEAYDPYKYLEFDEETGVFIPHSILLDEDRKNVEYMIETLGLNCVHYDRKKQLQEWKDRYENGLPVNPHRYVTAWDMTLKSLEG